MTNFQLLMPRPNLLKSQSLIIVVRGGVSDDQFPEVTCFRFNGVEAILFPALYFLKYLHTSEKLRFL